VLGVLAATQVAEAAHAHRDIGAGPIVRTAHGTFSATRSGERFRFRWQMSVRGDAGHTVSALVSVRYVPQPGKVRAKAPHLQVANVILTRNAVVSMRACRPHANGTATPPAGASSCHVIATGQDKGTFGVRAQIVFAGSGTATAVLKPISITTPWPLHPSAPTVTDTTDTQPPMTSIMPVQ
jgi:hypothetical protein